MIQKKVLVVDDEEELVSALLERLEMRGIPADGTMDGRRALERLAGGEYDVVVLDLMLPGLGGREVLRQIQTRYPEIDVLLITGHGTDSERSFVLPSGVRDILAKPFRIEALIDRIKDCRRERES